MRQILFLINCILALPADYETTSTATTTSVTTTSTTTTITNTITSPTTTSMTTTSTTERGTGNYDKCHGNYDDSAFASSSGG